MLAVHIADGVLPLPWVVGGFLLAGAFVAVGCTRLRHAEVPFLALLTAAFFVASLVHVRTGPTSVHLLLNGLAGVLLGRRAGLAIAVGLTLQSVLIGHGGFSALGVNICVMTAPAFIASLMYRYLLRSPFWTNDSGRTALVAASAFTWGAAALAGTLLLFARQSSQLPWDTVLRFAREPWTWISLLSLAAIAAAIERKLSTEPDFAVGLLIGALTTVVTVALNATVLAFVLPSESESIAAVIFLAHLPVAAIEGWIVGSVLSFLRRAAPHLLDRSRLGNAVEWD
jgi:cobalt/nickel transport system permease protein